MNYPYYLFALLLLSSCYGVNQKTSQIASLDMRCLEDSAWAIIEAEHSTDSIKDELWLDGLKQIKAMPFATTVLYFHEWPRELIAVSTEHYAIRYNYNPEISYEVTNGLSPELPADQKRRIFIRVLTELSKHQCAEGKEETENLIRQLKVDYNNTNGKVNY